MADQTETRPAYSFPVVDSRMRVSAWLPSSDIATPKKTIAELEAAGVSTAILMVNDFSDARGATAFRTFDVARINAMAAACHAAGIGVQLCSWVMPHEIFIEGAIDQLRPLMKSTGATVLMLDAESPWCEATGTVDHSSAAACLAVAFGSANMAVTAIGSAPAEVRPLAKACALWVPQCYADDDSQATPGAVVPYSLGCWRERYGVPSSWCIGLAAYNQADDPRETMWPPVDDVLAAELDSVAYWSSNAIGSRPDVTAFVRGLSESTRPHPGICPELRLPTMPSVYTRAVAEVQALLTVHGCDPGKIDGKPGPKTINAVMVFQRRKGLAATGIVDACMWSELLRP
jgi:hypothetical protein